MCFRVETVEPGHDPVTAVAALNLPLRRRIYDFVASRSQGANRDDTAAEIGVARSVAAFNLDKLAEVGLVDVEFRRPEGRGGPGAGRPAKWYRRAQHDVNVSVPPRHYDLAAAILAEAVERSNGDGATRESVREVAREHGLRIGAAAGKDANDGGAARRRLLELLVANGYEPEDREDVVVMANCPFHALVEGHQELVCTMNQALLSGVAEESGLQPEAAQLDPAPGRCCVTLALRNGAKRRRTKDSG